jgi:hypothetical protein
MPRFRLPAQLRLKYALIGAAGGALIMLPLGQVLQHQGTELTALAAERASLDPFGVALSVQRGVLAHRDAADRVLRGRVALEQERRIRQSELDERLRHLQDTLGAGWWVRALRESQSLSADWQVLARRVSLRQVNPAVSVEAHQLLMEQAVQVMDLIHAAAPAGSAGVLVAKAGRQLHGQQDLSSSARQEQLAELEALLLAIDGRLSARQAAVKEQQAATALALGALVLLSLTLAISRVRVPPPNPGPENDARARRNAGRRSTDPQAQVDPANPLMERLRNGESPRQSEPR